MPENCFTNATLIGQKYFKNVIYTCTNSAINQLNIELLHKIVINIYEYRKYVVLALTLVIFL